MILGVSHCLAGALYFIAELRMGQVGYKLALPNMMSKIQFGVSDLKISNL